MTLKANSVVDIVYTKTTKVDDEALLETTSRTIIPTTVPNWNIKAIDVTEFDPEQREELSTYYQEYSGYLKNHMKLAFSFEDWLAQSKQIYLEPKWRTFKLDQTEIIS